MLEYGLQLLWPTPIIQVRNPDHAKIKSGVMQFCYDSERRASQAVASGITPNLKSGLYESTLDAFQNVQVPEVAALSQFCMQSIGDVATQLRAKMRPDEPTGEMVVEIHESWVHVTRDRGFHDTHTHPNCSWCGVYCIEQGDSTLSPANGTTRFDPPFTTSYQDLGSEAYLPGRLWICPQDGLLVLFPSYLYHSATPYSGSRDRVVIAFNARVRPR